MSELTTATPSANAEQIPITIHSIQQRSFRPDGFQYEVDADVRGKPRALVQQETADYSADTWQAFRRAGMPVVMTMVPPDGNGVLLPDLRADGSEVYGLSTRRMLEEYSPMVRALGSDAPIRLSLKDVFMRLLEPELFPNVISEAERYERLAMRHNLKMPQHDPFHLVVHPIDRNRKRPQFWELRMWNLDGASVFDRKRLSPEDIQRMRCQNHARTTEFLSGLQLLRGQLVEAGMADMPRPPFSRRLGDGMRALMNRRSATGA